MLPPSTTQGLDTAAQQCYHPVCLDISSSREVEGLPALIQETLGDVKADAVHCLVNNAGIAQPYLPEAGRVASFEQHIATNLIGAFTVSEVLRPFFPPGDSAIVHISSTRAIRSEGAGTSQEGYAAAKAGLLGLTHSQAAALGPHTRVNVVLPGFIDTGYYPLTQADHDVHWAGRVGKPEDIAQMCLFLADPERSGFITGQEFVVDGGVSTAMTYPD